MIFALFVYGVYGSIRLHEYLHFCFVIFKSLLHCAKVSALNFLFIYCFFLGFILNI